MPIASSGVDDVFLFAHIPFDLFENGGTAYISFVKFTKLGCASIANQNSDIMFFLAASLELNW